MKDFIAYCGLDCENCEARLATIYNDDALRKKVAKEWTELNQVEITPEMINCEGCRLEGVKTPFCNALCPIRKCSISKKMDTCGSCDKLNDCQDIKMIISNNDQALKNLKEVIK